LLSVWLLKKSGFNLTFAPVAAQDSGERLRKRLARALREDETAQKAIIYCRKFRRIGLFMT